MNNFARASLIGFSFYILSGMAAQVAAGEYYVYRDSRGALIISNQKPPPGSTIIKQQTLSDEADNGTPQARPETQSNGDGVHLNPAAKP